MTMLVRIDPKSMLEDGQVKRIKQHLLKRISERINYNVTRSDLEYFESILRQADTRTFFYTNRKKVAMRYIPHDEKDVKRYNERGTIKFLINFNSKLVCLVFEDFVLKTLYRAEEKLIYVNYWNARSTQKKFHHVKKKETPADYIQRKINSAERKARARSKTTI